jgi:hypothetical protein
VTKYTKTIFFAVLFAVAVPVRAGLKDINTDKLPQDLAVRTALNDAVEVEEFVRVWNTEWRYNIPKSEVASRLKASLAELQKALTSTPDNEELLLLTGLVAHYAYNVDVEGSFDVAVSSLVKAHKIAPADYRPDWFLGVHRCQSNLVKEGMEELLSIERAQPWQQLPPSFWDDYLNCAIIANMPAHALRAGDHAAKLKAPASADRDTLLDIARKRFTPPDPAATYSSRNIWSAENIESQTVFTNTMFGLSFSSRGNWKANIADVKNGLALATLEIGPYPGKEADVTPNILVIVRQPKAGESLNDFLQSFLRGDSAKTGTVVACPSQECLASEIVRPSGYKAEGDARFFLTVFKRESPERPGLLFEQPAGLPVWDSKEPQFFHPTERLLRLDGTLYYLVGLDTADSVLEKARKDYEAFLKGIKVE